MDQSISSFVVGKWLLRTKLKDPGGFFGIILIGSDNILKIQRIFQHNTQEYTQENIQEYSSSLSTTCTKVNSSTTLNTLYDNFCLKKNRLEWTGTLDDLKAFVLKVIDENTAESTSWRSTRGGTWNFESEVLSVTWHKILLTANPVEIKLERSIENVLADDVNMMGDTISKELSCCVDASEGFRTE